MATVGIATLSSPGPGVARVVPAADAAGAPSSNIPRICGCARWRCTARGRPRGCPPGPWCPWREVAPPPAPGRRHPSARGRRRIPAGRAGKARDTVAAVALGEVVQTAAVGVQKRLRQRLPLDCILLGPQRGPGRPPRAGPPRRKPRYARVSAVAAARQQLPALRLGGRRRESDVRLTQCGPGSCGRRDEGSQSQRTGVDALEPTRVPGEALCSPAIGGSGRGCLPRGTRVR